MTSPTEQWTPEPDRRVRPYFTLAIASGKGGTGKTTISTAIAKSLTGRTCSRVTLMDCDVEEPNCHLFITNDGDPGSGAPLSPPSEKKVYVLVPEVDEELCDGCSVCSKFCRFKALINLGGRILTFHELCHNCGGCALLCPQKAITEVPLHVGAVTTMGTVNNNRLPLQFIQGCTVIGETRTVPVIEAVKEQGDQVEKLRLGVDQLLTRTARVESGVEDPDRTISIIDCPPGTSCPLLAAVEGVDHVVLVTEPTPFGLNDLDIAVKTMRSLQLPMSVIINRCRDGEDQLSHSSLVEEYCHREGIPVLLKIKESMEIAQALSRGECILTVVPELSPVLDQLVYNLSRDIKEQPGTQTLGGLK